MTEFEGCPGSKTFDFRDKETQEEAPTASDKKTDFLAIVLIFVIIHYTFIIV